METSAATKESLAATPQEKYMLGSVEVVEEIALDSVGIESSRMPRAAYAVKIKDPYLSCLDDDTLDAVQTHETRVNDYAARRREKGMWTRKIGTAYVDNNGDTQQKRHEWGDPVSHKEFFGEMDSRALEAWLSLVPSAQALAYLSDPLLSEEITNRQGLDPVPIDDTARLWLTACTDAVAIRSRGTLMAELVQGYVDERPSSNGSEPIDKLIWMSVACGTALPAMKAALSAQITPELILVDNDEDAIRSTRDLADDIGFKGVLSQHKTNIFNAREMQKLSEHLEQNGGRPKLLDLMGIFEYTGDMLGISSSEFLRSNYEMLHPGGRMIFGQMRSDRPNVDFTMGVVGWPWIMMRSPDEIMQIVNEAGIPPSSVGLFFPDDGVYTVAAIDKPK